MSTTARGSRIRGNLRYITEGTRPKESSHGRCGHRFGCPDPRRFIQRRLRNHSRRTNWAKSPSAPRWSALEVDGNRWFSEVLPPARCLPPPRARPGPPGFHCRRPAHRHRRPGASTWSAARAPCAPWRWAPRRSSNGDSRISGRRWPGIRRASSPPMPAYLPSRPEDGRPQSMIDTMIRDGLRGTPSNGYQDGHHRRE